MEAVPACGDIYSEEKENLLDDLQQKNGALNKAVEAAEKLRLENIYLEETLENLRKEQSAVIENYEQENHTLKNKLSVHEKLASQYESSLQDECENWQRERLKLEERLVRQHGAELAALQQQLHEANGLLEQEKLTSAQREGTVAIKNEQLSKLKKEVLSMQTSLNDTLQVEYAELVNENCNLKLEVQETAMREHELNQSVEQLQCELESLRMKEENWKYEKERVQSELSSCYEMIESCREENAKLREQINAGQNSSIGSKGNSLFAEVEDKRLQAEKIAISLSAKYKSTQRENDRLRHYVLKLKTQISTLLQAGSKTTDERLVRSLDVSLSNSRAENTKLLSELKTLRELVDSMEEAKNSRLGDSGPIAKMMENELKAKNDELANVREELRLNKIYSTIEAKKVTALHKEIFERGRLLDAANSARYRLQLEFDKWKLNNEGVKKLDFDSFASERLPCREESSQRELNNNSRERSADGTENNENDSEDADKENEAPPCDAHKSKARPASDCAADVASVKQSRQPLAEKTIDHKVAEEVTCIKKTEGNASREVKDTGKPRKRPGFENTIDTADCKQQ